PYAPFERWAGTKQGDRGADYETYKAMLGERILAAAENVIPGLRGHVVLRSVGTPLTHDFYCETPFGAGYGSAKTPWQMGRLSFETTTSVDGLYSCGASTICHGVAGAAMSGLLAAQKVLGAKAMMDLVGPADGSLRIYPADQPESWLPELTRATR